MPTKNSIQMKHQCGFTRAIWTDQRNLITAAQLHAMLYAMPHVHRGTRNANPSQPTHRLHIQAFENYYMNRIRTFQELGSIKMAAMAKAVT